MAAPRQYLLEGGGAGHPDDLVDGHEGDHDHGGAGHAPADHVGPPRVLLGVVGREGLVGDEAVHDDHLRRRQGFRKAGVDR